MSANPTIAGKTVPDSFPVNDVIEPAPQLVVAPGVSGLAQVWRWRSTVGREALLSFAALVTPSTAIGPVPGLTLKFFAVPGSTEAGSQTVLSSAEVQAATNPMTLSQLTGVSLPVPYCIAGQSFVLGRNLYVEENMVLLAALYWDLSQVPPGTTLWGYLRGFSWLRGLMTDEKRSQLAAARLSLLVTGMSDGF